LVNGTPAIGYRGRRSEEALRPGIAKPADAAANAPRAPQPAAPVVDGTFATEGSLVDALGRVVPTLYADTLKAALDSNDDDVVFRHDESKIFDEMALEFLKGASPAPPTSAPRRPSAPGAVPHGPGAATIRP
jgi:hypothetical protein